MKITIAYGQEDWFGLYVDDNLRDEGHSPDAYRALQIVLETGRPIDELRQFTLDDAQELTLCTLGRMPPSLSTLRNREREGE